MDINSLQHNLFPRQVNPARGSDQQRRDQGRDMQEQLQQAEVRERASEATRASQNQELWRPERRLDGRLVRLGPAHGPITDTEQARSNLMREKIARTYVPEQAKRLDSFASTRETAASRSELDLVV
ncbi:hypothetical protein [Thiohalophilus sp.]|uniref:hypothetical protein n=1 Tax=Thiohalophilus sp. TaxID=3028392 RepID=UPI0039764C10